MATERGNARKNKQDEFYTQLADIEKDNGFFDYIYSAVNRSGRKLNPYKITYYTIDTHNYLSVVFEED